MDPGIVAKMLRSSVVKDRRRPSLRYSDDPKAKEELTVFVIRVIVNKPA